MATIYILNNYNGGNYLLSVDGRPITFTSQEKADEYCLNMSIGLGLKEVGFACTDKPPANVA